MEQGDRKPGCFLCTNTAEIFQHDMKDTLADTKYTFSDVLCKLFKKEKLPLVLNDKDFTNGMLCSRCKDKVDNLYKLQYELREVKNEIVNIFWKSQKTKNENENVSDKASVKKGKNKASETGDDIKDEVKDESGDDVYIIESLREKKGNQFLVKWENYSEDENTWEPRSSIPDNILQVCTKNKIFINIATVLLSFMKMTFQGLVNLLLPRLL